MQKAKNMPHVNLQGVRSGKTVDYLRSSIKRLQLRHRDLVREYKYHRDRARYYCIHQLTNSWMDKTHKAIYDYREISKSCKQYKNLIKAVQRDIEGTKRELKNWISPRIISNE